jgi:hypothetical protein
MSYTWNLCLRIDEDVDFRNTVTLPEKVLEFCVQRNKQFPYFFSMTTSDRPSPIFVSVKQFDSHTDSEIGISHEFAALHHLYTNQIISVSMVWNVPAAHFISIEPLSEDFFSIPDYETLLEHELSKYAVLYPNQEFVLSYGLDLYRIKLKDIQANPSTIAASHVETCYNIINQDIETDIYNSFQVERYLQNKREEKEREAMKQEDINQTIKGRRVGGSPTPTTAEEMRQRRLSFYTKKR